MRAIGNKLMAVCVGCGKMVQTNKTFFGSFHICTTEEEQRLYSGEIARRVRVATQALERAR